VKSFLRISCVILIGSLFTGYFIVYANSESYMSNMFQDKALRETTSDTVGSYGHCVLQQILHEESSFLIVAGVPFYELVLYPLCQRYSFFITSRTKFKVGILFLLLHQLTNLALDVGGHITSNSNATLLCLFKTSENNVLKENTFNLSYYWLALPKLFSSFAYYLIFTSTSEFLCAQSPYSMKGLLTGLTYSLVTLFIAVNFSLRNVFKVVKLREYCGTFYFAVSILLTMFLFVVVYLVTKWYSRRLRRENDDEDQLLKDNYSARSSEQYDI